MKKKDKQTETEKANIELNKKLDGEEDNQPEVTPLINNNNPGLVVSDIKSEKDKNKHRNEEE